MKINDRAYILDYYNQDINTNRYHRVDAPRIKKAHKKHMHKFLRRSNQDVIRKDLNEELQEDA